MSATGFSTFDTTVHKTNQVLKQIEDAYGWPRDRRHQSYSALRAVLHALRDRLTVEEASDLAAQLPVLVRGLYYEGWDPTRVPVKMSRDEFLDRVRRELGFDVDDVEHLVSTVLFALGRYVTEGEWRDIKAILPRDLAEVIPS
jgi:uncharacterized protein (DUF2267 family)